MPLHFRNCVITFRQQRKSNRPTWRCHAMAIGLCGYATASVCQFKYSFVCLPAFQTSSSCWLAAFALLPPRSDSSRKRAQGAEAVTERMPSECAWASEQTARAGVGRLGKRRFLKGRKKNKQWESRLSSFGNAHKVFRSSEVETGAARGQVALR